MAAWQIDGECGPAPRALARRRDCAAVQFNQMFYERQPKTYPAVPPTAGRVGLSETIEDERQELRLDALTSVADRDPDMLGVALHLQLDPPAFGRELDRVREQVPHDLLQTRRVAENQFGQAAEIGDKRNALRLGRRAHRVERGFKRRDQVNQTRLDAQLARDDARRIEQVFDDLKLRLCAALDDASNFIEILSVPRARAQHPRVAEDGVQRRAQFV